MIEYNQDLDVGKHRLLKSAEWGSIYAQRWTGAEVVLEFKQDEEDITHGQAVAAWYFCWVPSVTKCLCAMKYRGHPGGTRWGYLFDLDWAGWEGCPPRASTVTGGCWHIPETWSISKYIYKDVVGARVLTSENGGANMEREKISMKSMVLD